MSGKKFGMIKSDESRKSFLQRNFTKMGSGSLRGSILALSASAIGSGKHSLF